ncbi:MAG: HAD family hydrolase [Candidatus Woesearchaeota archaeon]
MIKIVSFDLDGTLATEDFDNILWNEEIPYIYSKTNNISLEEAKKHVFSEYYKALYIDKIKDWTSLNYWSDRLNINSELIYEDMKNKVKVYKEVIDVLDYLSKKYELIVITNASYEFMKFKLSLEDLESYFKKTFSAPKISKSSKKDLFMYKTILDELNISSKEIVHIGDSAYFDKQIPEQIGIKCYFLDRDNNQGDISSLEELKDLL